MTENTENQAPRRRPLTFLLNILKQVSVEPFVFFCIFGSAARGVSFHSVLMDRSCRTLYSDDICDHIDDYPLEQAKSTVGGNNVYTGVTLLTSLPALVVAIFLGPWSDKYSRKLPILLAVSGMFAESLLSAVITGFPHVTPWLYAAASLCAGVTGGTMMLISACSSYLSEVTEARSRSTRFSILIFFNMSSALLGGFIGGQLFQLYGYFLVMSITPVSYLIAILYGFVFLKETKPKIEPGQRMNVLRDLVSLDNIKQSYRTCTKARPGNMRLQIWLLVWISCSSMLADQAITAAGYPFVRIMYKWGVTTFSNANIVFTLARAVLTVTVIPLLSGSRLQLHEAAIGLIGVMAAMAEQTIMSVAYTVPLYFFACVCGSLSSAVGISIKSRLSKLVPKDELGRAFSFLGIFESLTPLFGTLVFLQIYNASVTFFPGMAFAAGAVILIPAAIIFAWMMGMPTVSQGGFGREDEAPARPLEDIKPSASTYDRLEEDKY